MSEGSVFLAWVSLPPAGENLEFLARAAELAEPLVDFRYGTEEYRDRTARALRERKLPGLTVCVSFEETKVLDLLLETPPPEMRVILCPPWQEGTAGPIIASLKVRDVGVGVEVSSLEQADFAARAGADFLVVAGSEAGGLVASKTSFILLQELACEPSLPIVVRGGLGPRGAAAAWALGARGIILDSQLVLLEQTGLSRELRQTLAQRSPSDTEIVGETVGRAFRFLAGGGKQAAQRLAEREWEIAEGPAEPSRKAAAFEKELLPFLRLGLSQENQLLPVGQGIAFAQQFAAEGLDLGGILDRYRAEIASSVQAVKQAFPFVEGSRLAREHGVRFPIVQAPMAIVTDTPRLAPAVLRGGALPFCSTAGLKPDEVRGLLHDARALIGNQPFGLGLTGFLPTAGAAEAIFGDSCERPNFVTLESGNASQAARLEQAGIRAYVQASSQPLIRGFLDSRVQGIILEGHEAGGHVGALGSLVLWELGVNEILARPAGEVAGMRVLFAGGITDARSSLAAAIFAAPLAEREIGVGMQVGTAYLTTEDTVECGVVSRLYQSELLHGRDTILTGKSVNRPHRWLDLPAARRMIREEIELGHEGLDDRERKRKLDALATARLLNALGRGDGGECAFACGQGVLLQKEAWTIPELHEELTLAAEALARDCPSPALQEELPADAVAIVGMGCVFPGAPDVPTFWDNTLEGRSFFGEVPPEYWDWRLYYSADRSVPDTTYSKLGSFVRGFRKDPLKFRISPRAEPNIDVIQFYVLEAAYQALVDAGYLENSRPAAESTLPKSETAVFIGHGASSILAAEYGLRVEWLRFAQALRAVPDFTSLPEETRARILELSEGAFKQALPEFSEETCAGVFASLLAGRVAHCFNLRGRALVIDAACASTMAAVDSAVQALRKRECDVALAGGADQSIDPSAYVYFCSLGALSDKGSFPFDERADGFVMGEGGGVLVLKRLEDAIRDGNRIYAVIRAIGAASDGRVKGITAPDAEGQIRALDRAYRQVPFSPSTVGLLEGHGTATWVGDGAELTSIGRFFGERGAKPGSIGLGSVKSMIGHLKSAAGVAGLIKMAMALHTKILPPTLNCEQPRKDVDWAQHPCYLVTARNLWYAGAHPRRGGVNSFGFGGINFHTVLEEAPVTSQARTTTPLLEEAVRVAEIVLFRAPTRELLVSRLRALAAQLPALGDRELRGLALEVFAANSQTGPALSLVVRNREALASHLKTAMELLADPDREEITAAQGIYFRETPLPAGARIAFVFPGQGSLYPGMLAGMAQAFPYIEPVVQRVESVVQRNIRYSILDLLYSKPPDDAERAWRAALLERPDYNHPTMLAMSTALYEILSRAGIRPDMVAGHSLGEYAALQVAGVYDVESSIRVATQRGSGMAATCMNTGVMASVALPAHEVESYFDRVSGFIVVANRNCPAQTVVSGEEAAVAQLVEILSAENVRCGRLKVACGYHSRLMEPAVESFRLMLTAFPVRSPSLPVQCNITGKAYANGDDFARGLREVLVRHMVEPVNFIGNVESMYEAGARLFIEVGPGSTLCSFVNNILAGRPHWAVVTNTPRSEPVLQILHAVARCAALGLPVDLTRFQPNFHKRRPLRHALRAAQAPVPGAVSALPPAPVAPRLQALDAALAGENEAAVASYLTARGEFLRQMVELDFAHFQSASGGTAAPAPAALDGRITKMVVDLVARATGYPVELIDLDLDAEAELGLDSIKQLEILRELSRELKLNLGSDKRAAGYRIVTLRALIGKIQAAVAEAEKAAEAPAQPAASPAMVDAAAHRELPALRTDCYRIISTLVALPPAVGGSFLVGKRFVLLGSEEAIGLPLAAKLQASGAVLTESIEEADCVIDCLSAESSPLPALAECRDWWTEVGSAAGRILDAAQRCVAALRREPDKKLRWAVVSRLGGELGASGNACPGVATGTGLAVARILALENPEQVEGIYLDFDSAFWGPAAASAISQELNLDHSPGEIGYRDGARFEIVWEKQDLPRATSPLLALHRDSVVLAVGGARGVTALIAQELARRTGARFIVVGKSSEPAAALAGQSTDFAEQRKTLLEKAVRENRKVAPAELDRRAWEEVWTVERALNLARLRDLAAHVEYHQCDLADPRQVADLIQLVSRTSGRIDVVLQGSGTLPLKSIQDFSHAEFVEGMASKALGTMNLLAALAGVEVKAFVNLASIGSRWGNRGHAAYAAGHEVASAAVAAAAWTRTGRWWNVYFGAWLRIGMTARSSLMERLGATRISFIRGADGANFLVDEIEYGPGGAVGYHGEVPGKPSSSPAACGPFLDSFPSADPVSPDKLTEGIRKTLREPPRQLRIRELLGLPAGSLQLAQADLRSLDLALADRAELVLGAFLGPEERLEWNALGHDKRRREWLGGRIAAKTAVRMLLGPDLTVKEIRILTSARDRSPVVELKRELEGSPPAISISHSRDVAVALASKAAGLGVDVEAVSATVEELLPQFATTEEAQAFGRVFSSLPEALTLLWAAKEACRKALGARRVAAHEIQLREIRGLDEYGVAVFLHPAGEIRCSVFADNDYAWAAARSGGAV